MSALNEDTLVQATMADYLADALGWESVYAFNTETLGAEGTLGRASEQDVILTRHLGEALIRLNPGLPDAAYQDALRQVTDAPLGSSMLTINRDAYALVKDGVQASFRDAKGDLVKKRLRLIDFDQPENNHFLCVRELWIKGDLYRRRADIIGFVNGLPLLFVECKAVHKDIRHAYEQNLADYKDTIPHLFHHNAFIILTNGHAAKIGSLSSKFEHFNDWKRLEEDEPGVVDLHVTVPAGVSAPGNGTFQGSTTNADGTSTWNWRITDPNIYAVMINVGPYEEVSAPYASRFGNTIPMHFWHLKSDDPAKVAAFVDLHRKTEQVKRQAEEHAQLLQAQSARAQAEAARERMAFLADASSVLVASVRG